MKSGPNLFFAVVAFVFLLTCSLTFAEKPAPSFDLVITNAHIIDGTGSPWYSGDIGISNGKITAIGNLSETARKRTIDAREMIVAPGFIDMLGQSETTILVDPRLPSKIYQGITTEITGEGRSAAPLNDSIIQNDRPSYAHYHVTPDWRTLRQYFARLEKQGMGINLASYVGATQVRRMVLGDDDKQPTPATRANEATGAGGHARRRSRCFDVAGVCPCSLREDRRDHCTRQRSVEIRGNLRDAHAK